MARVVHRLVGQTTGERAVADHGDHLEMLVLQVPRRGNSERGREPGAGVSRAELVVLALGASQESREASRLAQRGQAIVAPGEDLPRIGLVSHVPHDLVARGVEAVTQRHGELDDAEPGADVAPGLRDHVDQTTAHLVGERLELGAVQAPDVLRTSDGLK